MHIHAHLLTLIAHAHTLTHTHTRTRAQGQVALRGPDHADVAAAKENLDVALAAVRGPINSKSTDPIHLRNPTSPRQVAAKAAEESAADDVQMLRSAITGGRVLEVSARRNTGVVRDTF